MQGSTFLAHDNLFRALPVLNPISSCLLFQSILRKHAYRNILKTLPPKMKIFR